MLGHSARGGHRRGVEGEERGDTLVEVLVALVIIGICVVPLLNSLIESFTGSTEHRSIATVDTLLKSFAEGAKSEIELNAPSSGGPFTACSTSTGGANYQVLSAPSPSTATVGTAVTIFGTGFHPNVSASAFSVLVGSASAAISGTQSERTSDANGNIQLTFIVPTVATGTQVLTINDNAGTALTSVSGMGLTVSSGASGPTTSAESGYTMGISGVQYLDSDSGSFESCSSNSDLAATMSGIESVTLLATAPTGDSDTLSFIVRNPAYSPTSIPKPTIVLASNPATVSRPTGSSTVTVTFTATVEPPSTSPQATGTVTWSGCTGTGQTTGSPNTIVATCTTTVTGSSTFGPLNVTASYGGDAYNQPNSGVGTVNVYAPDGSGTMTVSPGTVWAGSAGNTITLTYTAASGGVNNGVVDVAVPSGWTAPSTSAAIAGYTTASGGTVSTSGQTIQITGATLAAGQTLTITYGATGGTSGAVAPATTGNYTFSTSENSTSGGTSTSLATSPSVSDLSATLVSTLSVTTGSTITAPLPVTGGANVNFVIYAFTSNSGSPDSAALSSTGFTSAPSATQITAQAFDNSLSHAWAWYTTGGTGSGTYKVTFGNTIKHAFLDIVQIKGLSNSPPIVSSTEGLAVSGGSAASTATSNPATANLGGSPSGADAELIFLASQSDFGASTPTLSSAGGFTSLVSTDSSNGSRAIYRGLVTNTESLTMGSNQNWGTMALELNG